MVDEVITKQELIDAQKDAQSLELFISGNDTQSVTTRLSKKYPTLANAIRQIYEKGGKFYPTLADANADIANIRTDVYVITGDNGAYYKATAGAKTLTKSAYDPLNQAKLYTNAKSEIIESRIPYKNLFDKSRIRVDKYLANTNGSIIGLPQGAGWAISEYIPVKSGEYYTLSGKTAGRVSFFRNTDDAEIPVSNITGANPKTFQIPPDANYVVLNVYTASDPVYTNVQLEEGQAPTSYADRSEINVKSLNGVDLVNRLDDVALSDKFNEITPVKPYEIATVSPNLLDESKNSLGKYLANTTGEILATVAAGWAISGFIPLEEGETYTISGTRYGLRYTLFSGTAGTGAEVLQTVLPSTNTHTFVAPQNCYLVLSLDSPSLGGIHSGVQVERGAAATNYMPYGTKYEINPDYIAGSGSGASIMQISGANLIIRGKDHTGANVEVTSRLTRPTNFDSSSVFNFLTCSINDVQVMNTTDDVAPYSVAGNVLGANHGYYKVKVTATAHGKTTADCGSLWSANGKQWVLMAIVDANNLLFICATDASTSMPDAQLLHISDATNTAPINKASTAVSQLYPVFKNRSLSIFVDGVQALITDLSKNYKDSVVVKESYEVMTRSGIVEAIRANVGTQLTEFNGESLFKVNISYVFDHEAGCTIEQDFLILKATTLESLTMMQSNLFPATNGTVYYYVPKSLPVSVDGTLRDFRQPIDVRGLSVSQAQIYFTADELENPENPVDRAYQINNISVFATGFLPVADAKPARRLENVEGQFWDVRGHSLKTYPKLAVFDTSKPVNIGEYYSCISYKKWFSKQAEQTACFPIRSSAGDFLYIDWHSTGLKNVKIPEDFKHREFSVIEKSANVNPLSTDFIQDELLVNIQSGNYGYLTLKF